MNHLPEVTDARVLPSLRPTVSVCIANWNCRDLLRACLLSLSPERQRLRVEIIVVDNASSDGAADMVQREFPEVILVRNPTNTGFAHANNQAAQLAHGRYLFFLNNDTVVPPGALRKLCRFSRLHPGAGIIGPRLRDGRGRTQLSARRRPTVAALLHRLSLLRWTGLFRSAYRRYRGRDEDQGTRRVEVLMGAALLMPQAVYEAVGGWDESYTFGGEDIDLCARVSSQFDVIYHPRVAIRHHGRASSRQRPGWATGQTVIGITRSLRATGTPGWAVTAYKTLYTFDLPLRTVALLARFLWCKLRRREQQARRAWLDLCGVGWFVRHGLRAFWKA